MTTVLYMPSTPLNVLLSIAHAAAHQTVQKSYLVLIDQKNIENNVYFEELKKSTLFAQVDMLPGQAKGRAKLVERNNSFAKLKQWGEDWQPELVLVGSDRRVEFQYFMNLFTSSGCKGGYIDDGLYSYAGKPAVWYKDSINSMLKKMSYGLWWDEPSTVGASKWIDQAWLFQPQHAVDVLQKKSCYKIKSDWFQLNEVKKLSESLLVAFGLRSENIANLSDIDLFLTFPHPNDIAKMRGYVQRVEGFLTLVRSLGLNVAVKYHPRMEEEDAWDLVKRFNVWLAPSTLAFEFMLPMLKADSIVLGDVGTVVMTAKWLRPDVKVFAVLSEHDAYANGFRQVMETLQIPLINDFEEVLK